MMFKDLKSGDEILCSDGIVRVVHSIGINAAVNGQNWNGRWDKFTFFRVHFAKGSTTFAAFSHDDGTPYGDTYPFSVETKEYEDMPAKTMREGFTIGCDPEVFVADETGKVISAAGLIPGDKNAPHKVDGGAVQVDGMALEFNIDPCTTFEEFNSRVVSVMAQMKAMLPPGYRFVIKEDHQFDPEYYASLPDETKVLGCTPDYNAYTDGAENPTPDGDTGIRTTAGHIHIGWDPTASIPVDHPDHIQVCNDLVKHLDCYLGLASAAIEPTNVRRTMYGMAGAHRRKPYGVEYRVPSSWWISSKARRLFVWNTLCVAIEQMFTRPQSSDSTIQSIINSSAYRGRGNTAEQYFRSYARLTIPAAVYGKDAA